MNRWLNASLRSSGRALSVVPIQVSRFDEDQADVDRRRSPTHQPHLDDRAVHARRLQVAIGLVAADHVEHDVDPARNRRTQLAQPIGGTAFEHDVGAEGTARVGLAGRAGHGDPSADRLGDLDRCGADPRRAGVDERPTARS